MSRTHVIRSLVAFLALVPGPAFAAVVINEIMYHPPDSGPDAEWVELYNSGPAAQDLTGWYLLDDDATHTRCYLSGTLAPGAFLVVASDRTIFASVYPGVPTNPDAFDDVAGFGLGNGGDQVRIFNALDQLVDLVQYGDGFPWPASPDGGGPSLELFHPGLDNAAPTSWGASLTVAPGGTPGAQNSIFTIDTAPIVGSLVRDVALPGPGDAVTVTATAVDDLALVAVELWVDTGAGFAAVPMSDDGSHGDGAAGDSVFGTTIAARPLGTLVRYYVAATDSLPQVTRFPAGAPSEYRAYTVGHVPPLLRINELVAANTFGATDEAGEHDDWLEILNAGDATADLEGLFLSNNLDQSMEWPLPAVSLPPGGRLVVWCDATEGQGPLHASFRLSKEGDDVALFDRVDHGNVRIHGFSFGLQGDDVAYGYFPEGSDVPEYLVVPTPGADNDGSEHFSPVCINEFLTTSLSGGVDDWVELYNRGPLTVQLGGWHLTDDAGLPDKYTFPAGTGIPPGGYLVVDESQLGFGLSSSGGDELLLTDPTLSFGMDYFDIGPQTSDVSQGRLPDGTATWRFFGTPTRGAANACVVGLDPGCPAEARLEVRRLAVGGERRTVTLRHPYVRPVVVCSMRYDANTGPAVVRVADVTETTFDVWLQAASEHDVAPESVSCLVVEEGAWVVDGVPIEAARFESSITDRAGSWLGEVRSYAGSYVAPVVLGQVMSDADPDWSFFWCRGATRDSPPGPAVLHAGKAVGQDPDVARATETIGYVVLESGHGTIAGVEFEAGLGADTVQGVGDAPPYEYEFETPFGWAPPVAIVGVAGMDGDDGAWAQTHGAVPATADRLRLSVDEDQYGDAERSHTTEQVGYAVFAAELVYPPRSCSTDGECADGLFCNGTEACVDGACRPGHPVECDDGLACTADTCDEAADRCESEPLPGECPPLAVLSAPVADTWTEVELPRAYVDPVVIAGPPTRHDPDPGVVRIDRVTATGFRARFDEWTNEDGVHAAEDVSFLVVERGRHVLDDGSIWEAGTFPLSGTAAFAAHAYGAPFDGVPALFLTAQTRAGSQPVVVRARNVTATGFEAALFEEQAWMDGHAVEQVGWLAVRDADGSGVVTAADGPRPFLLQRASVDERPVPVLSWTLAVEEDRSADAETEHVDETLAVLSFGGHAFAQDVTSAGFDTVAPRRTDPPADVAAEWGILRGVDHRWTQVPLVKTYADPVIVARPASSAGADPGVVRLHGALADRFRVRFQEWKYLDEWHTAESVFYLVVESGAHTLGGLALEAGRVATSRTLTRGGWHDVAFATPFDEAPAVLTSVGTFNGSDPVTTRVHDRTAAGFRVTMQEEEGGDATHTTETLGWVAIEVGAGATSTGRAVEAFVAPVGDSATEVPFLAPTDRRFPSVLADLSSTLGWDPCVIRYTSVSATGVGLRLEEERSADGETAHLAEDASILVAE